MYSLQFKQLLIRELSSLSENSRSGSQVAEWVSATYTGVWEEQVGGVGGLRVVEGVARVAVVHLYTV